MTDVYRPDLNGSYGSSAPLDETRCKAGVWSKERWARYAQCNRKADVDGWCKQHHPDVAAARQRASAENYNKRMRKDAMGWYGEGFMRALIKIRDGDNDPRETARQALAGCEYAKPTEDRSMTDIPEGEGR